MATHPKDVSQSQNGKLTYNFGDEKCPYFLKMIRHYDRPARDVLPCGHARVKRHLPTFFAGIFTFGLTYAMVEYH